MDFMLIGLGIFALAVIGLIAYALTRAATSEEPIEDDWFWDEEYNAPEERRQ